MDNNTPETTSQLILRRLDDPFSQWAILLPVLGAVAVYMAVMFFRYRNVRGPFWSRLLHRLFGPPWAAALLAAGCAAYAVVAFLLTKGTGTPQGNPPSFAWYLLLGPVVALGFVYVGFMYFRDARSVGAGWATFLGILRGLVYAGLGFLFLLPGWTTFKLTETRSKVLLVFDVSGSMLEVDDLPEIGQDPTKLPRRLDKVINLLTDNDNQFLRKLLKTNPVTCYRFGLKADEAARSYALPENKEKKGDDWLLLLSGEEQARASWSKDELQKWLIVNPNRSDLEESLARGTNIGDSLLQVLDKEDNNKLQAIVVVSDGQNNEGREEAYETLKARAAKKNVPIMCIGVGKYKPPISIRVNDLEAPQTARPDEPFPVVVPVTSQGLKGEKYQVLLEARRVLDRDGKPVKDEVYPVPPKASVHKEGEPDRVEFEINVADLKNVDLNALKKITNFTEQELAWGGLEGTWEFRARVARDHREAFNKPFHTSPKVGQVKVTRKKLRVLLLAGGPGREYQFVKTLFYREVLERRMEVGIFLQTNDREEIDLAEDAPQEWMLDHFPNLRVASTPREKPYTLFDYDLVIAFDPDWEALPEDDRKLLKDWVLNNGGGMVLIAGPVNTFQAREPKEPRENDPMAPVRVLYPVVLDDSRLQGLGEGFNPTTAVALKFPGARAGFDFLKLNEEGEGTTAGWDEFFYGTNQPDRDAPLLRGFYRYYPVKRAKSTAEVIATFPADPAGGENRPDEPYIVTMSTGTGRVVYLGSDEMWRLRGFENGEKYYNRFWIKLARFVGSGSMGRIRSYGYPNVPERMTAGDKKRIEYQLRGPDRNFLKPDAAVNMKVIMRRYKDLDAAKPIPEPYRKLDLKPKEGGERGKPNGWFMADFDFREEDFPDKNQKECKIQFELQIPGTPETLINNVIVTKPNPETDNTRPNLMRLYRLASANTLVINRLKDEGVKRKLRELEPPLDETDKEGGRKGEKLYFDLGSANLVPDCMIADRETRTEKDESWDFRDWNWDTGATLFGEKFQLSWLLVILVSLLSLEWLVRKLLKLA